MSDLISRQDIKYHVQLEAMGNGQYEEVEIAYRSDIESLPSADRPTGEWIIHDEVHNVYGGVYIECSECGTRFVTQTLEDEHFCPNCGARMYKGGEDE